MEFVLMLYDLLHEDEFAMTEEADHENEVIAAIEASISDKIGDITAGLLGDQIGAVEHAYLKAGFINGWLMARKCFQGE